MISIVAHRYNIDGNISFYKFTHKEPIPVSNEYINELFEKRYPGRLIYFDGFTGKPTFNTKLSYEGGRAHISLSPIDAFLKMSHKCLVLANYFYIVFDAEE